MQSAFSLAERPSGEILAEVRRGLPAGMFDQVAASLGVSTTLLATRLGVARRTLTRKQGSGSALPVDVSEKVLRIARIRNLARRVFSTDRAVGQWLFKRDSALGSVAPIDILDTEVGGREVEDLLVSLAHGQFV
ncbi:MAG TPA: antitoxin Xre-like helix-turn-helix domain-containing protein [Steroidobacteraceae bacterium]|jgi:putative toxin-antitoxin system antitoxin component (TIGR02293 family)